jgi:hypothetical protein
VLWLSGMAAGLLAWIPAVWIAVGLLSSLAR